MAPFAGRIRDGRFAWDGQIHELAPNHAGHAMHGTVFDRRWLVELADVGYLRLRADLQPGLALRRAGPSTRWRCRADRLELRLEVHTDRRHASPPRWAGTRGSGGASRSAARSRSPSTPSAGTPAASTASRSGSVEAPPPTGPWDDCFTAVTWPVAADAGPGPSRSRMTSTCDHVVLYDEPRHAICVEPQTGPPDALNHLERATIVRPRPPAHRRDVPRPGPSASAP